MDPRPGFLFFIEQLAHAGKNVPIAKGFDTLNAFSQMLP